MNYLDAVDLAKLKNLSLRLGSLASENPTQGRHRSFLKGFSRDFAQHRAYAPGDELKTLDWKVYARTDRFYVKEFANESVLSGNILMDASGSMSFFTDGREPKWSYACRLGMALSYLILNRGDSVGLLIFNPDLKSALPSRGSLSQLRALDEALFKTAPAGKADLPQILKRSVLSLRRRSLVVLISDLMGPPQAVIDTVRALKARKTEIMILHVLDPAERDFPFDGPVEFEGLEDAARFYCEPALIRRLYREEFAKVLSLYASGFSRIGAAYAPFFTDEPWDASLSRFLSRGLR
ncbi:MAG: DUF58 domain-containing protein [Elusimicrobiota bacterium]